MLKLPRLDPASPLGKSVSLGASDTLKLFLTTVDGKIAQRPHQAFLTLTDPTTGLEESFVLNVKESGKGKVDVVCNLVKDWGKQADGHSPIKISLTNSSLPQNQSSHL